MIGCRRLHAKSAPRKISAPHKSVACPHAKSTAPKSWTPFPSFLFFSLRTSPRPSVVVPHLPPELDTDNSFTSHSQPWQGATCSGQPFTKSLRVTAALIISPRRYGQPLAATSVYPIHGDFSRQQEKTSTTHHHDRLTHLRSLVQWTASLFHSQSLVLPRLA